MKAVVKTAPGEGNVSLQDIAEPMPPAGHVLIAVQAAGICGTDIHIYHDEFRSWPPVVLGHEVSGRIVALGEGVTTVSEGDRVTTETYFSTCGVCRFCRDGRVNLCLQRRSIGSAVNGGFTSLLVVPARNVHPLPDTVSFRAGALVEPLACVVHGVLDAPKVSPNDLAVVAGPGAIGLLTLQVLRAAGVRVIVIGTAGDAHRLELAQTLGAEATFKVDQDDFRGAIEEQTNGLGADLVYECSGAGPAARDLLTLVRRGGQYAQIGLFGKPVAWDLDQVCYKELSVSGSNASVPSAWRRALDLLSRGDVQVEPLISHVYPLADWREAFETVERRIALKTLLSPIEA
ncbi:MAG: putative arabitol-phosphate dehydrogenase [Chloroflexi bacterium]|nr:putative arabitol-phosphate dehydrogenase [Chloroflexota bacterium]